MNVNKNFLNHQALGKFKVLVIWDLFLPKTVLEGAKSFEGSPFSGASLQFFKFLAEPSTVEVLLAHSEHQISPNF